MQLPGASRRLVTVVRILWANRKTEIVAVGLLVDVAQQIIRSIH